VAKAKSCKNCVHEAVCRARENAVCAVWENAFDYNVASDVEDEVLKLIAKNCQHYKPKRGKKDV